ncbi:S41 family peptidase [Thiohalomonas denitrificans]|uniref:Carboxyl-terminal processing protease n=1 Tax=Thiohalomonas denitrificans TaxID=415747 RepID=A0A1G5QT83_9GAMM|nr:S41 family peptidase [Thiohalomonas denitrificans]SCZ65065.1 carboxyl-terminal processing protease [Thiohalomonas denitrificans]
MKSSSRFILILAMGLVLGFSFGMGSSVLADRPESKTLPLEELRTFSEIFGKIKGDYVEEVTDEQLLEYAIRGMLSGLDPHSAYMNEEEFHELQVGTSGEFGGLGIEVGMEDGFVKVVSPIDDTPAQQAGVKAGDLVIRLDEAPVKEMDLSEAVKIMRGKPGTDITLTIVRDGVDKPLKLTITRDIIKVKSVKSRTLEDGYGYLRITNFQNHTTEHVERAVSELKKANGGSLRGLVLDLRNNPGGVLGAAVGVADAFLEKGLVVYTDGRASDSKLSFNATPEDVVKRAPIVVLINSGSASASEIVAGALQDHKRAVIMGTPSFGKGSVQTIFPMSNSTAVKLTTARYYTPSGRSIQAEGIEPDITLDALTFTKVDDEFVPLKEADLNHHLSNGSQEEAQPEVIEDEKLEEGESLASQDYALHEALTLLKGLNILQARTE